MKSIIKNDYILKRRNKIQKDAIISLLFMKKLEFEFKNNELKKLFDMAYENETPVKQYHDITNFMVHLEADPKSESRIKEVLRGMCFVKTFGQLLKDCINKER